MMPAERGMSVEEGRADRRLNRKGRKEGHGSENGRLATEVGESAKN